MYDENNFVCDEFCDTSTPCLLCEKYGACHVCRNFYNEEYCNDCILKIFYKASRIEKEILMIEDEPAFLKNAIAWINKIYRVSVVRNLMLVNDYLKDHKPNLILFDYEMAYQNGFLFYQYLKELPETAKIPVVFLKGSMDFNIIEPQKSSGFIDKSIGDKEICRKIVRILGK